MKILVYSPQNTPRIQFAISLVFKNVLCQEVEITADKKLFEEYTNVKICYSYQAVGSEFHVAPSDLLHKTGIDQFEINVSQGEKYPYFFKSKSNDFEFDLFSASFFLASRYEEYWPHKTDKHNRFSATESIAFKNKFLHLPLINLWADDLFVKLKSRFGDKIVDNRIYNLLPTIDVDSAFAYKEKGLIRTGGAYARSLFQGNFGEIKDRTTAILGIKKDPYDVFDELIQMQKKYEIDFLYFFLIGDYGLNDKNVAHYSRKFQALIKHIYDYSEVAIHPSFASNEDSEKVKIERDRLSQVVHSQINKSRQHFLIIQMPSTFRTLIHSGIEHDYSMGYPDEPGFRASICSPYPFYDLELEQQTQLMIHPFCFMEATYKYYKTEDFTELKNQIKNLSDNVKQVKGEFCVLWHNDSLSETHGWENWSSLFEEMIQIAK